MVSVANSRNSWLGCDQYFGNPDSAVVPVAGAVWGATGIAATLALQLYQSQGGQPVHVAGKWGLTSCDRSAPWKNANVRPSLRKLNPKLNRIPSFIMAHPIIVIASFLTTIKSTWELSRMVREKRAAKHLNAEANNIRIILQRAYRNGLLLEREYNGLSERLMRAEAAKDGTYAYYSVHLTAMTLMSLVAALQKIYADFRAILARASQQPVRRGLVRQREMKN
ncbi:hypothetical protein VTH82DRAFT_1415 [Thermothelomyces myriococcoides]